MTQSTLDHPSRTLATFAAGLRFEDLPPDVLRRAEELFLDWFGSALAGKGARPVRALERFAELMGRHRVMPKSSSRGGAPLPSSPRW